MLIDSILSFLSINSGDSINFEYFESFSLECELSLLFDFLAPKL